MPSIQFLRTPYCISSVQYLHFTCTHNACYLEDLLHEFFCVCFFQQIMVVFEFKGSKLKVMQRLPVMSRLQEVGMLYADD